ncbi:DUF2752 domain-containing protein [Flexivirga sp. ID2601S]|uniref:DUF2752 domain-containing protein n=1 Tax=Flexivirga aerilata TaxID=1656889 RepID=A0A849ASJ4_9MICO|nr:DUF2752 domain-containing protein [Flexivirga aerilata]NNG39692.1 DUF2752 domain-containing protein [Flexivirga aerilata]
MTTPDLAAPRTRQPSRADRVRGPLLGAVGGVAALVLLRIHDPHGSGSYGYCPFLTVTGAPCPLCGGLRAMNDLTHGNLSAALLSNAAAVFILVAGAVLIARWFVRRWKGDAEAALLPAGRMPLLIFGVAMIVFTVYRWTPWGSWLYQG